MSKYKAGDKVVLTVTGTEEAVCHPYYVLNDKCPILERSIDEDAEPLTAYTEPLETKIENLKKKLKRWVEKCANQSAEITRLLEENMRLKPNYENIRAKGQNEAWELARKIFDMERNDIEDIFIKEDAWNLGTVLNNYTYQEAAAKVAEWEKAKEEIKAGMKLKRTI